MLKLNPTITPLCYKIQSQPLWFLCNIRYNISITFKKFEHLLGEQIHYKVSALYLSHHCMKNYSSTVLVQIEFTHNVDIYPKLTVSLISQTVC